MSVTARLQPLTLQTYPVGEPERNPLFFEKRVYQGSSGKVYPVPFIDKVSDEPRPVTYRSALLENDYVRLVMLPEIGGRIYLGQDKTNHDYDFFYRNDVIKPALVGLAGPWISGGVEFNWPQHHRPSTFMPTDVAIEEESDGARTVWMSEHDPINRLKGLHGIRLRPGSSLIELRARLFNRTPLTQTFLWWANVAARVHDRYQSFFPPDVNYVADHGVRGMSSFPKATNPYYGVDYQNRPDANDLGWYRNIPVPTSYMVCQTKFDFFGGYDFDAGGGFVHVADRFIAPGKKQWTWGDHEFGWAWDRELTDVNGPYVELMAGVYTDNQPDFAYLAPFETKTFSQYWWPIQGIGPVQQANKTAALRLVIAPESRKIELGLCVSERVTHATLTVRCRNAVLLETSITLDPGESWSDRTLRFDGDNEAQLHVTLTASTGENLLSFRPVDLAKCTRDREVAAEPPAPADVPTADELYLTGEHLEQYRHPTRAPERYWEEALRRDPGDARSNLALGRRALRAGRFAEAGTFFQNSIARLTRRHPNPETGEAHYFLALTHFYQDRPDEAYAALSKATWNFAWRGAARYLLACIDSRRDALAPAQAHLREAMLANGDHSKAKVLLAALRRREGHSDSADPLRELLRTDPLDHWARYELVLRGELSAAEFLDVCRNDAQTILDLAFDYADAGMSAEAADLLELHLAHPVATEVVPNPLSRSASVRYALAWIKRDDDLLSDAREQASEYFFPSRLHEQILLEWALSRPGKDPVAAYGLGNYLHHFERHEEAIDCWQRSVRDGAGFATVHRNLGIAVWNARRDGEAARDHYLRAIDADPTDSRLVVEYDQLSAKLNAPISERLQFLHDRRDLALSRDDCAVALASLHNLSDQPAEALRILTSRRFHPWEGGEGSVLRQFTTAHVLLGRKALSEADAAAALEHFQKAMSPPPSLGEAYHLLQARADVSYWIGRALSALGRTEEAKQHFILSAEEAGDFSEMAIVEHSPLTYYRALSLRELGRDCEAASLLESLLAFAETSLQQPAKIDYFATSLPNLLVFDEDFQSRRDAENNLLIALARHGLGEKSAARTALAKALAFTNADQRATDLSRELA